MLLSKSVALAILGAMAADALVIPNAGSIDVFGKLGKEVAAKVHQVSDSVLKASESIVEHGASKVAEIFQSGRQLIPHKYIVVMKENATDESVKFHMELVGAKHSEHFSVKNKVPPTFSAAVEETAGGILDLFDIGVLKGYAGYFLDETLEYIRNDPNVAFVEQDSTVYANEFDVQKGAPWGLARVSHRQPLSLNLFNQYLYDDNAGEGVTAYVIDTGVNVDHIEFQGRAKWGSTVPTGDVDQDGNGHGTHCAGTIGSSAYGVAKKADIVAVKVLRLNGSGSMSDVVKGVEFAAKSHQAAVKQSKKGFKGSTANMSLGGGKSPALDLAVNAAVKAGLHFAVAAGNENQDACNTSPAAAENAITVGASTISDARAYFSNYGKCVDIFAPGLNILSTYIGSDSATATLSGTSMASPHICGLLSYYLSLQPGAESEFFVAADGVTPLQLKKNLIHFGSTGLLTDVPEDTPNILAFNGGGHNLTDFWGKDAAPAVAVKESGKSELDAKFDILMKKVNEDLANIVDDIKKLVDSIYE